MFTLHFIFCFVCFFFNDTATTEIYTTHNTLSLHDALPISSPGGTLRPRESRPPRSSRAPRSEEHTSELQSLCVISYAVFCLKKKKTQKSKTFSPLYNKQKNIKKNNSK